MLRKRGIFENLLTASSLVLKIEFGVIAFIVPTFDTKVMEYLCSGWVSFLQTNFDFLTSQF